MKTNFCRKILIYIGLGLEYESIMIKELEIIILVSIFWRFENDFTSKIRESS